MDFIAAVIATFGGGSVKLQTLGPDGSTYLSVNGTAGDFSANGTSAVLYLPPGPRLAFTVMCTACLFLHDGNRGSKLSQIVTSTLRPLGAWHFVSFFLKVGSIACREFITRCNGTPLVSPELFPLWKRHKNSGNLQRNAIVWPSKRRQRNSVGR